MADLTVETGRMVITVGLDSDGDLAWQFDIEEIELVPAIGMLTGVLDRLRSQLQDSFIEDEDLDDDDTIE